MSADSKHSMDLSSMLDGLHADADSYKQKDRAQMQAYADFLAHNPGAFVGVSLGEWLKHVAASGVPHVPATQHIQIEREAVLSVEDTDDPAHIEQLKALAASFKLVPADHMLRWDPCAPLHVKIQLQKGDTQVPEASVDLFDPRAFDIIYQYPLKTVPVYVRPWIKHKSIDGYPIEFRVFVEDGEIKGVANYYIQRALPENEEILGYVSQVQKLTHEILKQLHRTESYPWMPNYERGFNMDEARIHATLDFMVSKDGEVLFLEAGPPFGAGAHPCAFMDKELSGVALGEVEL